jgi:hypothetical protein
MSGCDMMMCGTDVHGGNAQRGCGRPFVWVEGQPNSALPYVADLRSAADYATEDTEVEVGGGSGGGGGGGSGGSGGSGSVVDLSSFDGNGSGGNGSGGNGSGGKDASHRETVEMRTRRLERDAREQHWVRRGVPVRCSACAAPIVGPRLQCMQCEECVDLCVGCVARDVAPKPLRLCAQLGASGAYVFTVEANGGSSHPKQHVFRRVRQRALDTALITDVDAAQRQQAALGAALVEHGVVLLEAHHVQGRPGLSAAAAAAASAATARAAASATMRGSSAESGASGGGASGGGASGAEHGSRKRPAPPSPAAAQGLGSRKAKAGASSHEPIELSDGE